MNDPILISRVAAKKKIVVQRGARQRRVVNGPGNGILSAILAWIYLGTLFITAILTACGHSKQARVEVPPPPGPTAASQPEGATKSDKFPAAESEAASPEPVVPPDAVPLATETGLASWYGPPYHNRRGSNGEVYNMNAMTAAHSTMTMGTIVRVTNVKTGDSALVRITDRGPFIPGRVVDLSLAAARKLNIYKQGVAAVRVEVMQTPSPIDSGGRWAVQIGGFPDEDAA